MPKSKVFDRAGPLIPSCFAAAAFLFCLTFCSLYVLIVYEQQKNEIRRRISAIRAEMARVEEAMRNRINYGLDCTESALRLMALRAELLLVVDQWRAAGGSDRLPTVEERLKAFGRTARKLKASTRR